MIELPKECYVNKFIPKKTFYEKVQISTKIKQEFTDKVDKIIWKYKISEDNLNIKKTETVEEIEIFQIYLRETYNCKNIIKVIQKNILYPILFEIISGENVCYSIEYGKDLWTSEWNDEILFQIQGINLKIVHENLVRKLIKKEERSISLEEEINKIKKINLLEKEISKLKSKIKKEKQFNRKVEYNEQLIELKHKLGEITSNE